MSILQGLEPASVFHYFEEICAIPHTSYHEQQLSDYCAAFAKDHGLFYQQDDMGNILIVADATPGYANEESVILQGHLDMVGDKTADCTLDLEKDGLELYIDGDFIRAKGTTLGGDDGIAVAYGLAILDAKDIPHPRLEVIFTVSEEVGLLGASAMDLSICKARKMINVDSEIEGIFTAGCAGGRRGWCTIPVNRAMKRGLLCTITLNGLLGGHSGTEIHKGRANANVLMGRFLLTLKEEISYGLLELSGGAKENVIPKESKAVLIVSDDDIEELKETIDEFQKLMETEYGTSDPDIKISFAVDDIEDEIELVLDNPSLDRVITLLALMPNGVQTMSADLPGLVESSLNNGFMLLENDSFQIRLSIRSSVASIKDFISAKVRQLTEMMDGSVEFMGDYPAWPYARNSKLRDQCIQIYKEQYGKEPKVELLHAGLECGIFSGKIEGLDCISFGPDLIDIHTPNEHMSISSVQRVWDFLKALLAAK